MKIVSTLLLLITQSISAFVSIGGDHPSTSSALFSLADLKADLEVNPKTFVLDVRELDEWTEGHLAVATPTPLSQLFSGKWMDPKTGKYSPGSFPINRGTGVAIELNRKVYVHSNNGGEQAREASQLLTQMGYADVVALEETFDQLAAAGLCEIFTGTVQKLTDDNG